MAEKNTQRVEIEPVQVSRKDLPLSCPRRDEPGGDKHPRVFLQFDSKGEAVCPYCSRRYILAD